MAIASKTAVETEYAAKRDAILAYTDEQLNTELDSLTKFAEKLRELATLLRAKEVINDGPVNSSTVAGLAEASAAIATAPGAIRAQFKQVKKLLAAHEAASQAQPAE